MTAIIYPDMTQKNSLPTKYNQDGYRMVADNKLEPENTPSWYNHGRPPPYYTDPNISPFVAQTSQERYTNSNASRGMIKANNVEKEESRWWDWSATKVERNRPIVKAQDEFPRKRENSYQNIFGCTTESLLQPKRNSRYSATPQYTRAIGIVPITDLKTDDYQSMSNTNIEKVSYGKQYESQQPANYNLQEKRHVGFANEETKPSIKPFDRSQANGSAKVERTASMWDLFHPNDEIRGQVPTNAMKYRRPLPQIKQTEKNDIWQNAPFASDYQVDPAVYQPSMIKHAYSD